MTAPPAKPPFPAIRRATRGAGKGPPPPAEPPPACGGRDGEDGALPSAAARPGVTVAGGEGAWQPPEEQRVAGWMALSLPLSHPRPAGGDTNPSRPPTGARGARPACSAGPRQRKETGTNRDEEAAAAPAPLGASAAAASFFAQPELTPAACEVTRAAGRRAPSKASVREDRGGKSGGGRKRERKRAGGSPGSA